jgi:NAD(P)H-hydrate epimerase
MARPDPDDPLDPSALRQELARERGERPSATFVFTRDGARQLDVLAREDYAIPTIVLMENAGAAAAEVALEVLGQGPDPDGDVLIVCGPGNNGGDGLVVARHLHNAGVGVRIALLAPGEKLGGDAGVNLEIARRMKLPITALPAIGAGRTLEKLTSGGRRPALLVDALLGTGVKGSLRGPVLELIPAMNELRKLGTRILSIDLPSGMDADTGASLGQTVIADMTVTMAGLKKGFESLEAQNFLGDTVVADIGLPRELLAKLGRLVRPRAHQERERKPAPAAGRRTPGR